jgi:sulfite exporter TauE/SafE
MPNAATARSRVETALVLVTAITGALMMAVFSLAWLPAMLIQQVFLDHST